MVTIVVGATVIAAGAAAGGAAVAGGATAAAYYKKYQYEKSHKVFGKPLEEFKSKRLSGEPWYIPIVCEDCIGELYTRGLFEEGLFRIGGSLNSIQQLAARYDMDKRADLTDATVADVSGLLKLFLRELPEPLILYEVYEQLNQQLQGRDLAGPDFAALARPALEQLAPVHRRLLCRMLRLLKEISLHEEENKMGVANLAIVFGPCFVWIASPENSTHEEDMAIQMQAMQEGPMISKAVGQMIEHVHLLFDADFPQNEDLCLSESGGKKKRTLMRPWGVSSTQLAPQKSASFSGVLSQSIDVTPHSLEQQRLAVEDPADYEEPVLGRPATLSSLPPRSPGQSHPHAPLPRPPRSPRSPRSAPPQKPVPPAPRSPRETGGTAPQRPTPPAPGRGRGAVPPIPSSNRSDAPAQQLFPPASRCRAGSAPSKPLPPAPAGSSPQAAGGGMPSRTNEEAQRTQRSPRTKSPRGDGAPAKPLPPAPGSPSGASAVGTHSPGSSPVPRKPLPTAPRGRGARGGRGRGRSLRGRGRMLSSAAARNGLAASHDESAAENRGEGEQMQLTAQSVDW